MAEVKFGRRWVGVDKTDARKGIKKSEVIDEVAQLTGVNKGTIRDVLNAFTDVAQKEMVMNGIFNWPGLPTVTRFPVKSVKRYTPHLDKTLVYPEAAYLKAKIPVPVKKMLREIYKEQYKAEYGTTDENWWEPFVYCDGDWRTLEKEEQNKEK